jgi:sigma-54 specific flagellar transcriptional regulator A
MTEILPLAVIDDSSDRTQSVVSILQFIGQPFRLYSVESWGEQLSTEEPSLGAIVFGSQVDLTSHSVESRNSLPIVSILDRSEGEKEDSIEKRPQIVASLNWPIQQNELLSAIHACQKCVSSGLTVEELVRSQQLQKAMVGQSSSMAKVRQLIEQVADSDASVLVLGESGTGKEVAARNLHDLSDRSEMPFVPINCGAIPAELLESELFGHEKGAFTGALTARKGRFELAEGGTIFLDEIGDMPMPMQVKLLRVLQERTFEKVGSSKSIIANVRIIAATHRNLMEEVKQNRFREDLYYRLNVFPIEMPALRERVEDIAQLVNVLVTRLETEKRGAVRLSPNAIKSLMCCGWPGNVRELANLIERLCILFPYGVVDIKDLPMDYQHSEGLDSYPDPEFAEQIEAQDVTSIAELHNVEEPVARIPSNGVDLKQFVKKLEIAYIEQALTEEDWIVARAAKRLTMQRTTLVEKMRKYQVQKPE